MVTVIFILLILALLVIFSHNFIHAFEDANFMYKRLHRNGEVLYLPLKINNHIYKHFIVDTGSTHSLISKSVVDKANIKCKPNESNMILQGVTNDNKKVYGSCDITLHLHKRFHKKTQLQVVDLPDIDGIIGLDWLTANSCTIDIKQRKIKVKL